MASRGELKWRRFVISAAVFRRREFLSPNAAYPFRMVLHFIVVLLYVGDMVDRSFSGYAWWFPRLVLLVAFCLLALGMWRNAVRDPYARAYREDTGHRKYVETFIAEEILVPLDNGRVAVHRDAYEVWFQRTFSLGKAYALAQKQLEGLNWVEGQVLLDGDTPPVALDLLLKKRILFFDESGKAGLDQARYERVASRYAAARNFATVARNIRRFEAANGVITWDDFYLREHNTFPVDPIVPRGRIYDRNGQILTDYQNGRRTYTTAPGAYHVVGRDGRFGVERHLKDHLAGKRDHGWPERLGLVGNHRRGDDVRMTIDADISRAVYDAFVFKGKRLSGAAVVIEVETGRVLASVSSPEPEPGISFAALEADPRKPLLNRAWDEIHFPGSTYKSVVAAAMLEYPNLSLERFKISTDPFLKVSDRRVFKKVKNHGNKVSPTPIDMKIALTQSSNTYFARSGTAIGELMIPFADRIGFNESHNLLANVPGADPLATAPPLAYRPYTEYRLGNYALYAQYSIGQNRIKSHPMHMAAWIQALAADGKRIAPTLVQGLRPGAGAREFVNEAAYEEMPPGAVTALVSTGVAREVKQGLWGVMNVKGGTGYYAPQVYLVEDEGGVRYEAAKRFKAPRKGSLVQSAGKTGTAQDGERKPHAWFIGFAPSQQPRYAVAVVVENAGYGSTYAIPIFTAAVTTALNQELSEAEVN